MKASEEIAREALRALRWHPDLKSQEAFCDQGNLNVILTAIIEATSNEDVTSLQAELGELKRLLSYRESDLQYVIGRLKKSATLLNRVREIAHGARPRAGVVQEIRELLPVTEKRP